MRREIRAELAGRAAQAGWAAARGVARAAEARGALWWPGNSKGWGSAWLQERQPVGAGRRLPGAFGVIPGRPEGQKNQLEKVPTGWYGDSMAETQRKPNARQKLLDAALRVIREQGYAATSVDALCQAAGVTKGAFFHHFANKEDLGVAAAEHWAETTGALFAGAPYHAPADPLDRVLAYVDFRRAIIRGAVAEFTCLVGTMVQETYGSNPRLRDACAASIAGHAATLEADIAAAMAARGIEATWTPASLALHTQAVLQGAFILAKARDDAQVALDSVDHLRRYIELLFETNHTKEDLR